MGAVVAHRWGRMAGRAMWTELLIELSFLRAAEMGW